MQRHLTCIICPLGCELTVQTEGEKILSVTGNTCPRGERYAMNECTAPVRTLTTTVLSEDGTLIPVKSAAPISKEHVLDAMALLRDVVAPLPVKIGDVIAKDVFGTNIIATTNHN